MRAFFHSVGILAVAAILAVGARAASTAQVIYSFGGGSDGEYADTDLVADKAGNIYGTSVQGGLSASGTVFELSPSGGNWIHTVLYSFTGGNDGGEPYKGVTLDAQGNLYGTAVTGGTGACEGGCGVVYKLTNSGGTWTQSVIHNFNGNDGSGPGSGVTFDRHGNLYGVTPTGGANGLGVIYQMRPGTGGSWKFKVIHNFTGGSDGSSGMAGRLILDKAGNLFGVATTGGANGSGVAFELVRSQTGQFTFKTLYPFKGQPDAGFPYGGLLFDKAGNLYGTTYYDGANDLGSVYQLAPQSDGTFKERVLYSFKGTADGDGPISTLVADQAGNLYGTASENGAASCGCGTIFRLTHGANGKWTESTAYNFTGVPDGAFVYNGMVVDSAGNMYGATVHGGTGNDGAIYQFTP